MPTVKEIIEKLHKDNEFLKEIISDMEEEIAYKNDELSKFELKLFELENRLKQYEGENNGGTKETL